jgi:hypothetical protein
VGPAGFSRQASFTSLVFDSGIPYVGYTDYANGLKATVKKFDSLSVDWVDVGAPGFSAGGAVDLSFAFDSGTPYVAYTDYANSSKLSVMKFNGTNWVNVGAPGFSLGTAYVPSIAFDSGTPYVAFEDVANSGKVSVMKFNGTNWVNVGSPGFSARQAVYISLAFDSGIPYVAFVYLTAGSQRDEIRRPFRELGQRGTSRLFFRRYNWYFSGLQRRNTLCGYECVFSPSWGLRGQRDEIRRPFGELGKCGSGEFFRRRVTLYLSGLQWGNSLCSFQDEANAGKSCNEIRRPSGNWVYVGSAGFSAERASYTSLAFNSGTPYVVYSDYSNGGKANVMKFTGEPAPTCYALTLSHTGQGSNPVASPANSTGCPTGQYVAGATINLSGASPTTGWQIAGWTGTANDSSTTSTNTLTMPASARTASVNYAQIEYTLTINSAHGSVTKNPSKTTYHYGDIVC